MKTLNRILCIGLFPILLYVTFFGSLFIYHRYVLNYDPEFLYSLGSASDTSVKIWMRARGADDAVLKYKAADGETCYNRCKTWCELQPTKFDQNEIQVEELADLKPGCKYEYKLKFKLTNGSEFETDHKPFETLSPKSDKFSFVFGSCMTKTFAPWNKLDIFCDMKNLDPKFGLFLGDSAYMDFNQAVPFWRIPFEQAYLNILTEKCVKRFMESTPSFIMFDDHEVENDFVGGADNKHYTPAIETWSKYIGVRNPKSLNKGDHYFTFNQSNADFFVLDARTYRSSDPKLEKTFLGSKQKSELKNWLLQSKSTFKMIGSPVSWSSDGEYPDYHDEIDELLDFIVENKIKNVVLLTGDMHFGAAYRFRKSVYEFAASPFQSLPKPRPTPKKKSDSEEELFFSNFKFHFGQIEIDDKSLTINIYGYDIFKLEPKLLFTYVVKEK